MKGLRLDLSSNERNYKALLIGDGLKNGENMELTLVSRTYAGFGATFILNRPADRIGRNGVSLNFAL